MAGNQYPDGCAACLSLPAAPQKQSWAQRAKPSPSRIIPHPRTPGQRAPKAPEGTRPVPGERAGRRLRWLKAELPLEPGARGGKGDPMAAEIEI